MQLTDFGKEIARKELNENMSALEAQVAKCGWCKRQASKNVYRERCSKHAM